MTPKLKARLWLLTTLLLLWGLAAAIGHALPLWERALGSLGQDLPQPSLLLREAVRTKLHLGLAAAASLVPVLLAWRRAAWLLPGCLLALALGLAVAALTIWALALPFDDLCDAEALNAKPSCGARSQS